MEMNLERFKSKEDVLKMMLSGHLTQFRDEPNRYSVSRAAGT